MPHFYSTFARGVAGTGLLLLRLGCGANLVLYALMALRPGVPWDLGVLDVLAIASGLMLAVGLFTPVAGVLVAVDALLQCLILSQQSGRLILLATVGAALAMIGPGIWSIDARRSGWQRLQLPARSTDEG